jgi:hypothetical protein
VQWKTNCEEESGYAERESPPEKIPKTSLLIVRMFGRPPAFCHVFIHLALYNDTR